MCSTGLIPLRSQGLVIPDADPGSSQTRSWIPVLRYTLRSFSAEMTRDTPSKLQVSFLTGVGIVY